MSIQPAQFEGKNIRRIYDEATDLWWFSVIDVIEVLTDSRNPRDYWFKLKQRVKLEDGAELSVYSQEQLDASADEINNRPRKGLGVRSPLALYRDILINHHHSTLVH